LIQKRFQFNEEFDIASTEAKIGLTAFCEDDLDPTQKSLIETLVTFQDNASVPVGIGSAAASVFNYIDFGSISASNLFFLCKFLKISYPLALRIIFSNNTTSFKDKLGAMVHMPHEE